MWSSCHDRSSHSGPRQAMPCTHNTEASNVVAWFGANRAVRVRLFLMLIELPVTATGVPTCQPVWRYTIPSRAASCRLRDARDKCRIYRTFRIGGGKWFQVCWNRSLSVESARTAAPGPLTEGPAEARNPPVYDGYAGLQPRRAVGRQHIVHPVTLSCQLWIVESSESSTSPSRMALSAMRSAWRCSCISPSARAVTATTP